MATATGQKCCVFVGNIPYDATEEQLIEICQEVGPVVSFRLVLDRETGKPKGYGFCEYKDEETALSARRNLQGYEINGRQLRVDFAENDKGSDRNREQGRGGPGTPATNASLPKQMGGPAAHGDSIHNLAIGLQVAMKAAADMAKALGGPQASMYQNGLPHSTPANDQLTFHLAKLSRNHLTEILAELKGMATYNKESARQLLLARPHLCRALFQAEIMLDLVTPQVLQMSNLRQAPIQPAQPVPGDALLNQQQTVPTFSGLPPLVQRTQPEMLPKVQQIPNVPQSSSQATMQPQVQLLQQPTFQIGTLPGPSGSFTSISARPVVPPVTASSTQYPRPLGAADLGYNPSMGLSTANSATPSLIPHRPSTIDAGFQPGTASSSMPLRTANDATFRPGQVLHDPNENINGQSNRPSKLMKLEDGRGTAFSKGGSDRAPQVGPSTFTPAPIPEGQHLEKQTPQSELPPDVESVLLQQVMNLTPEQISSLPPEQQQQVIQLQEMIRRDKRPPP